MNIEDAMLTSHIRATMGDVMTGAEQLKGLAQTPDGFCGLSAHADAEEMRQVAVGIKATAIHSLVTVANVAGLSERLSSVAAVLEAVIHPESEPPAAESGVA
jgi:cobalamin synthase